MFAQLDLRIHATRYVVIIINFFVNFKGRFQQKNWKILWRKTPLK